MCMMQGVPNYMEDNWAVFPPSASPPAAHDDGSGEGGVTMLNEGGEGAEGGGSRCGGDGAVSLFSKEQVAYYGVFDGHNGYGCSLYARVLTYADVGRYSDVC